VLVKEVEEPIRQCQSARHGGDQQQRRHEKSNARNDDFKYMA